MRQPSRHPHDGAVADTVGSILMVAITVGMAAMMALLLVSLRGPVALPYANLAVGIDPGAGGWGTGDESIRVQHNGGEALPAGTTTIAYSVNGVQTALAGASLGGPFAAGALNLGETWSRTLTLASADTVTASVASHGPSSVLLARATLTPGAVAGGACLHDTTPPTVQSLSHGPALTSTSPPSTVTVTLVVQDNCAVNGGAAPLLEWGYLSAGTFPNSAVMAFQGGSTFTGLISPAQAWALRAGDTLQYRVSGYKDAALNTGALANGPGDRIELASITYPTLQTATVVAAAVPALPTVQAADGTAGAFVEAASTTSGQVDAAGASGTVASGAASDALTSNDARAVLSAATHSVTATGFTAPGGAAGISHLTIGFEGRRSATGGTDPGVTLSYTVGGSAGASAATQTLASATDAATYTLDVSGDRAWTGADLASLAVTVQGASFGSGGNARGAEIDKVFVLVTYAGAGAPRTLALQYDWGGPTPVPTGAVQTLEMRYHISAAGDTFTVQVHNAAAGTWRSCATQLTATLAPPPALPNFACPLSGAGEFNGGAPRIRILDNSATSTVATTLSLDYVRVVTM